MFANADPVHFGTLHTAMISLFKVLTLEGWTDIMNIQLYGTANPSPEITMKSNSFASIAYFVSFILLGAMIIMNLFIGVIMNSMQESHEDIKKELIKQQQQLETGSESQTLLKELDDKIDKLKLDIQKLSEILNR